jgi:gamma-glutamylcyclotransferase (GGCT)/AIG2-like uncharacterized protein YtfP
VYGALKQGQQNHHWLKDADYLGSWRTPPHYKLWDLGGFPGVRKSGQTAIIGELYNVTSQVLFTLDRLEGYRTLYDRKRIQTIAGPAWIYLLRYKPRNFKPIASGEWNP